MATTDEYKAYWKDRDPRLGRDVKYCPDCGRERPVVMFNIARTQKDGLSYSCRECHRIRCNSQRQGRLDLGMIGSTTQERSLVLAIGLVYYKGGRCQECGLELTGPRRGLAEFHHRDNMDKKLEVRHLSQCTFKLETLKAEADKCDLLCRACHIRRHAPAYSAEYLQKLETRGQEIGRKLGELP